MSEPFIGGDLLAIRDSAKVMKETAISTGECGARTSKAADQLLTDINAAMEAVTGTFNQISEELTGSIETSHNKLKDVRGGSWGGRSAAAAESVELHLKTQVERIRNEATVRLNEEQGAFNGRAQQVLDEVGKKFHTLMGEIQVEYQNLSKAAADTATNFELADDTISVGG